MEANPISNPKDAKDMAYLKEIGFPPAFKLLRKWLAGKNDRRHELAVAIMRQLGPQAVGSIVDEAMRPRQRHEIRVRLLKSLVEIGVPLNPDDEARLMMATASMSFALVRQAAMARAGQAAAVEGHAPPSSEAEPTACPGAGGQPGPLPA
jgi:hypothetical protein